MTGLMIMIPGNVHANMGPMNSGFYRYLLLGILAFFLMILVITWNPSKVHTQQLIVVVLLLAGWAVYIHRRPPVHYNDMIFWIQARAYVDSYRLALESYSADSTEGKYPVGEYRVDQFLEILPGLEHPDEITHRRWIKGSFLYASEDGTTYLMSVDTDLWSTEGTIIATPGEILPEDYYDHIYLYKDGNGIYWEYLLFERSRIKQLRQKFIEAGCGKLLK
jgi:hypothetical protein